MRKCLYIILSIAFLSSCVKDRKKEGEIPLDKMKVVVWQLMKADEYFTRKSLADSTWKNTRKNVQFYQQIFDLNKVDRAQFYQQINYLETHPVEFKVLMDSVSELSKREKKSVIPL